MNQRNGNGVPGLPLSLAVPIIGTKRLDENGIRLAKSILEMLEKGEVVSIAVVAEKNDGKVIMAHSPGTGEPMRTIGGLSMLQRRVEAGVMTQQGG